MEQGQRWPGSAPPSIPLLGRGGVYLSPLFHLLRPVASTQAVPTLIATLRHPMSTLELATSLCSLCPLYSKCPLSWCPDVCKLLKSRGSTLEPPLQGNRRAGLIKGT